MHSEPIGKPSLLLRVAQAAHRGVVVVADTTPVSTPPPPCAASTWITARDGAGFTKRLLRKAVLPLALAAVIGVTPAVASAASSESDTKSRPSTVVDLGALFISAHPDDEAGSLATFGQWKEQHKVKTGVVTITRGEGGGNAVGLEEGPPLGIIREREERTAVGKAGIENVYNLDGVDFFYTASAPLSEEIWGTETLEQIVRVIRQTRPELLFTMNPSPTPGNHGNHQQAARFAAEAYRLAAEPSAFPEQISDEGLSPWRVSRFFRSGASGTSSAGPNCASTFTPTVPTDQVFGVWEGTQSTSGKTWAQIEVEARREYVTQGWANTADAPTNPANIRCDFYTQIDSRVPYDPADTSPEAMLRGAVLPQTNGGLPLGTEFFLTTDRFDVAPGESISVTAHVRGKLTRPRVTLDVPDGWTVQGSGTKFTVTVPSDAKPGEQPFIQGTLTTARQGTGTTDEALRIVPTVRGTLEPLEEVGLFRDWAAESGFSQLDNLIKPVITIGSGRTRDIRVDVHNYGDTAESGQATLSLPVGFSIDAATKPYTNLAPGTTGSVTFRVTNTDTSLPTANEGGDNGDYPMTITTSSSSGTGVESAGLEIVPTVQIGQAAATPVVDGVESPGEYSGQSLDLSRIWEGTPTTPADASGSAKVVFTNDALHIFVTITDDVLGKKVVPQDCKRQRRTDSIEIDIDPKGNSANTSTVFKAGIFPITDDPANGNPPCFQRDADNRQGPGEQTAPGMKVASKVSAPYAGYTIETVIPFSVLPDAVDPLHMGLNILVYDSDTQDLSSQSRLGWSTFQGVRADPYRYGLATLPGYTPPNRTADEPIIPDTAARSMDSPQSIAQSAVDGVAPAAAPKLPSRALTASVLNIGSDQATVRLRADRDGTAYLYTWDGDVALGSVKVDLRRGKTVTVTVPISGGTPESVLVAFESEGWALARSL